MCLLFRRLRIRVSENAELRLKKREVRMIQGIMPIRFSPDENHSIRLISTISQIVIAPQLAIIIFSRRLRSFSSRMILRRRNDFGVHSRYSSS